jgi:hypothetical protein
MLCHFWLVLEIWNFQKRQSRPNERHLRRRAEMPSTVAALNRAGWLKYNHRFCIAQLRRFQRIFDHLTVMAAYRRKRGRSEIAVFTNRRVMLIRGCRRKGGNCEHPAISFKTCSFDGFDLGHGRCRYLAPGVHTAPDRVAARFSSVRVLENQPGDVSRQAGRGSTLRGK